MRTVAIKAGAVALVILTAIGWFTAKRIKAAPQETFPAAACTAYVPPSWGEYKGGSQQSGLAFEDKAGTLRFLMSLPCGGVPAVALEIRRSGGN